MGKENVALIQNETLFSLEKEGHLAICNNMDGPERYYVN